MPNPSPMHSQKPFSLAAFRRVFATSDPVKLAQMVSLMPWDYFTEVHEFSRALDTNYWTTAVTAGGGPTAFALNAQRNGALRGATGTTSNDVTALHYANVIFDPSDNPFFWVRWVAPAAVTGFSFEIGFSNAKTSEALPGVTSVDTPTTGNGVTDITCIHMDTNAVLTTAALVADGTTGAPSKTNLANRAGTAWAPTASAIIDTLIGVRPNLSFCWIWDSTAPMGVQHSVAQGPDAGVLVRPYMQFRTRNTTSKTVDLLKAVIVAEENRTT